MYDQLMKKLGKKGKKLEPNEKEAKMNVVKELSKQAGDMMGDKVKGLNKVSVAAPDKKGLEKGLDMANKLIKGGMPGSHSDKNPDDKMEAAEEEMGDDLDKDSEEGESEEHKEAVLGEEKHDMAEECKDMSPEDIEKQIQALQDLKQEKLAKA